MYKKQEFIQMEMKIISIILQGNPEKKWNDKNIAYRKGEKKCKMFEG